MVDRIERKIISELVKMKLIEREDEEIYVYGMQTLYEKVVSTLSIILITLLCNEIMAGFLFWICFKILRSCAGGYHAASFIKCYILSTLCFTGIIFLIKYGLIDINYYRIAGAIMGFVLIILGPLDCENKRMSEREKSVFYRREVIIIIVFTVLAGIFMKMEFVKLEKVVESTVILNSATSIFAVLKNSFTAYMDKKKTE